MMEVFKALVVKSTFNGDISKWDTGKVTTMYYMFYNASCVQPRHWELEHSASDYYEIYVSGPLLRSTKPLGSWNTAQVTDMRAMFYSASAFNQDIGVGTQRK